jgi:hypothetical protein
MCSGKPVSTWPGLFRVRSYSFRFFYEKVTPQILRITTKFLGSIIFDMTKLIIGIDGIFKKFH